MAIEIVDFPINSMVIFHSYVKLPEGITTIFLWFSYDFPIKPPLLLVKNCYIPFFSPISMVTNPPIGESVGPGTSQ